VGIASRVTIQFRSFAPRDVRAILKKHVEKCDSSVQDGQ
jgi:hypothetical protein